LKQRIVSDYARARTMPVSSKRSTREYGEVAVIFGVYLIIYWFKRYINNLLSSSYPSTTAWFVQISFFTLAGLCLLLIMEKVVRRRSLATVGFRFPTNKKASLIFTVLLVLFSIGGILLHIIYKLPFAFLGINFFSGVVLGPLVEEIVFRGLIQTRFETGLGVTKSWILSTLLFGLYHIIAWFLIGGKALTTYSITQLAFVVVFAIFLGILFAKTKSLLPPFLLHAVNNFIAFLH